MLFNKALLGTVVTCALSLVNGLAVPAEVQPRDDTLEARSFANGLFLRIMPLGASITHGVGSSTGNGYRAYLRDRIEANGNAVQYVGSHPNGDMRNPENEGWPGFIVDEVRSKAEQTVWYMKPNLVLINAGTNDCVRNIDIPNVGVRVARLMDAVWAGSPRATIVMSTLLQNRAAPGNVAAYNEQIRGLVWDWQNQGRRVVLADMQGPGSPGLDLIPDGTHPNDQGFQLMSNIWFDAIADASRRGYLQPVE
ncbi:hypothetical protein DL770_008740 [Monosporascus sp. CRB-9-2]|nr:hypothetical protein DL770_008740 [Monosporascus sp. CRB-9-2]